MEMISALHVSSGNESQVQIVFEKSNELNVFDFFRIFMFSPLSLSLSSQQVCIRPRDGYCCIQYSVCEVMNAFSLTGGTMGFVDSMCTTDYVDLGGKEKTIRGS